MQNILFLHGALATKIQFNPLITLLEPNYTCHALNFAGHGGEIVPPAGLTFETFAKNILDYLDKNKIEKTNLFGFSMGGYAAMYFAKQYPNRVEKIITLNVKFNWDPISTAKETGMLDPDKMLEKIPGFANNLIMQHGMLLWKNLLKQTSDMMNKLAETVVMSKEEIAEIKAPTLLCVGDRDQTSSIGETREVYKLLPNAQFMVLPGTAHPFEKVNLHLINEVVKQFFA